MNTHTHTHTHTVIMSSELALGKYIRVHTCTSVSVISSKRGIVGVTKEPV